MRPLAAMGALNFISEPNPLLVKIACPVSALSACRLLSPWAPTAQMIVSAPFPVVLAIGDPFPLTLAHQAVAIPGGDPAVIRRATRPFAPEQPVPLAGKARMVPVGVPITVGAVITTPFATRGGDTTPPPIPPRLSRSARCSRPSLPRVAT